MSEPRNIKIFEEIVARLLDRLYRSFPNPMLLDSREVGQEVAERLDCNPAETFRILDLDCASSMNFLVREGFVEFEPDLRTLGQPEAIFPNSVLTLKGFALLGSTPSTVDQSIERRPIAQQLSEALDAGARDTVGEIIKKLFFGAISVGTSALGG